MTTLNPLKKKADGTITTGRKNQNFRPIMKNITATPSQDSKTRRLSLFQLSRQIEVLY